MPRTEPGILPPYQERPQTYPTEFKLAFDPKTDSGLFFPLIFALSDQKSNLDRLTELNKSIPELYAKTRDHYEHFFDTRLSSETPDPEFDRALRWAAIAIDQGKVRFHDEAGLVAGYYESGGLSAARIWLVLRARFVMDLIRDQRLRRFRTDQDGARIFDPPPARGRKDDARIRAERRPGGLEIHALFLCLGRFHAVVRDGDGGLRQHQRRRGVSCVPLGRGEARLRVHSRARFGWRRHLREHGRYRMGGVLAARACRIRKFISRLSISNRPIRCRGWRR